MTQGSKVSVGDLLNRGFGGALQAEQQGLIKSGSGDAETVPEGDYDVKIDYVGAQKSDHRVLVAFAVIESGPEAGKRVSLNPGSLKSPESSTVLLSNLRALAGEEQYATIIAAAAAKGGEFSLNDLVPYLKGKRVQVTLGHNIWQDVTRMQMKIGRAKPLGDEPVAVEADVPAPQQSVVVPTPDPALLAQVPSAPPIGVGVPEVAPVAAVTAYKAAF